MRYLVTGGAGFIGSHLAEELVGRGHDVHVYDNVSTGRLTNIEHLFGEAGFTNTIGDILDRQSLENALKEADEVIHLAAVTDPQIIAEEPLRALSSNIRGTENVLDLAVAHDKKVLYASTGDVYGLGQDRRFKGLISEDDDWRSAVGDSHQWATIGGKAIAEYMARQYHQERELPVIIVRLFDIVGPRQSSRGDNLLPRLVQQAIQGAPMEIPGNGEQVRYFTYVSDATWAMRRLLRTPGAEGNIYNLGTQEKTTINELARRIRDMTGSSSEIVHLPAADHGPDFSAVRYSGCPDITRLHRETGFEATYTLEEILIEIITDQPAPWSIFSS